mmetsp:Transcript_19585/g.58246  ORF Transcript_19585/g.58246 Transcript_19585/m.58246 type:complete len:153 (+) Transcript_19585:20-478(+)
MRNSRPARAPPGSPQHHKPIMLKALCAFLALGAAQAACPALDAEANSERKLTGTMAGGFGEWQAVDAALEAELAEAVEDVRARVAAEFAAEQARGSNVAAEEVELCRYKSQVVAGVNYRVVVSAGSYLWEAKIYKPLPYTKKAPTVTSFERL